MFNTSENKVIFIDVPQKIINTEFERLSIEPIEKSIRNKVGNVISSENLEIIPRLIYEKNEISEINSVRESIVFNVNKSAKIGADILKKIISNGKLENG